MSKKNEMIIKIADCCRMARIRERLSQKEMGEKCGVTQQYISQFESGEKNNMQMLFYYISICGHMKEFMDLLRETRDELNGKTD